MSAFDNFPNLLNLYILKADVDILKVREGQKLSYVKLSVWAHPCLRSAVNNSETSQDGFR